MSVRIRQCKWCTQKQEDCAVKKDLKGLGGKYSLTHTECNGGEIFITNTCLSDFKSIGWSTKRMGITAYDINGKVANGLFPVFISGKDKEEYLKIIKGR